MQIVGGVYLERCIQPRWNQLYGSAGRAAAALAALEDVELHTYVDDTHRPGLETRVRSFGRATLHATPIQQSISFDYVYPLSVPVITPAPELLSAAVPLRVSGELVLRYGMMEGDAIVAAKRAVYDPQSASRPAWFRANGSTAEELAVVANAYESHLLTKIPDPEAAAMEIMAKDGAKVVVVKRGSKGALVLTPSSRHEVPAYKSRIVFKIGSGDIFAAAFAYFWGRLGLAPERAADLASKATALYCESRSAPLPNATTLDGLPLEPMRGRPGRVYLAGPFFALGSRWLVEEARARLLDMQHNVFSPVHDVGPGPAEFIAPSDLSALDTCDRMLALLDGADPWTLFEVGYARAKNLPVVAYSETLSQEHLKMVVGSGCTHTDDFATAIYLTSWLG